MDKLFYSLGNTIEKALALVTIHFTSEMEVTHWWASAANFIRWANFTQEHMVSSQGSAVVPMSYDLTQDFLLIVQCRIEGYLPLLILLKNS